MLLEHRRMDPLLQRHHPHRQQCQPLSPPRSLPLISHGHQPPSPTAARDLQQPPSPAAALRHRRLQRSLRAPPMSLRAGRSPGHPRPSQALVSRLVQYRLLLLLLPRASLPVQLHLQPVRMFQPSKRKLLTIGSTLRGESSTRKLRLETRKMVQMVPRFA